MACMPNYKVSRNYSETLLGFVQNCINTRRKSKRNLSVRISEQSLVSLSVLKQTSSTLYFSEVKITKITLLNVSLCGNVRTCDENKDTNLQKPAWSLSRSSRESCDDRNDDFRLRLIPRR